MKLTIGDLRALVPRGPDVSSVASCHALSCLGPVESCAEVGQYEMSIFNKDIFWLDVLVEYPNAGSMKKADRVCQTSKVSPESCLLFRIPCSATVHILFQIVVSNRLKEHDEIFAISISPP